VNKGIVCRAKKRRFAGYPYCPGAVPGRERELFSGPNLRKIVCRIHPIPFWPEDPAIPFSVLWETASTIVKKTGREELFF